MNGVIIIVIRFIVDSGLELRMYRSVGNEWGIIGILRHTIK